MKKRTKLMWHIAPEGHEYAIGENGQIYNTRERSREHLDAFDEGYEPGDAIANGDFRGTFNLGEGCRQVLPKRRAQ